MLYIGDVFRLDDDSRATDPTVESRWAEWIRGLGLNPDELMRDAVVRVDRQSNKYELHVSKIRRTADGDRWIDHAKGEMVSEPVIVTLDGKCWPEPLPIRQQAAV